MTTRFSFSVLAQNIILAFDANDGSSVFPSKDRLAFNPTHDLRLMLRSLANLIMHRRAERLAQYVTDSIGQIRDSEIGSCADIGSGTGHNAARLASTWGTIVDEFDVCDIHWHGAGPTRLLGPQLPCDDESYDVALLLYVLQYPDDPQRLLKELHRILKPDGMVVVLQCSYRTRIGGHWLKLRELAYGPVAFYLARAVGLIGQEPCSVIPKRYYQAEKLAQDCLQSGFRLALTRSPGGWLTVSDRLLVLMKQDEPDGLETAGI